MQKKFDFHKYILKSSETVIKAITKLQKLENKFCLILDERNNFLGTLVDGDIRRGLLKHYNINDNLISRSMQTIDHKDKCKLIEKIPNKYPYDSKFNTGSVSDFYLFKKKQKFFNF